MVFLLILVIIAVVVVVYIIKDKVEQRQCDNALKSMTDEELKKEFMRCAELLDHFSTNGNGLTGLGSTYATNRINDKIVMYQNIGRNCAEELASRGYTVDISVLNVGSVSKGRSKKSVIGNAIVGGLVAGAPGAIVGAIHALDKNSNKQ